MIYKSNDGVILSVYVQPKASKTQFVGVHGNALKFRVAAPPIEGEANALLCEYLAKLFSISQRSVSIHSGQASRKKQVELHNVTEETVRQVLGLPTM